MAATAKTMRRMSKKSQEKSAQVDELKRLTEDTGYKRGGHFGSTEQAVNEAVASGKKVYTCARCGGKYINPIGKFFKNETSPLYKFNDGFTTLCGYCVDYLFDDFKTKLADQRVATILMCHLMDYPFYYSAYDQVAESNFDEESDFELENGGSTKMFLFGKYIRVINNFKAYKGQTFTTTLLSGELNKSRDSEDDVKKNENISWDESDIENKNNCIEIIGYDPFEGFQQGDRKYLFNELIKYLDSDENTSDTYKLSQIIQVVINNCQIRNVDLAIGAINPVYGYNDIKNLTTVKQSLVTSNDKIAKENEISVKNRSNKDVGRNTLTFLMRDLRQKNFEKAETNYYDQLSSAGTQWAADMSLKAIKENAFFDENDYKEMSEEQFLLIKRLQKQLDDQQEKYRLLAAENSNLKKQLADQAGDVALGKKRRSGNNK